MMSKRPLRIGIITSPISQKGVIPLSNLISILYRLSNQLCLITGNEGYHSFKEDKRLRTHGFSIDKDINLFIRIINQIHLQLSISFELLGSCSNINLWIFFIGGEDLLLPMVIAKLMNKRVILLLAGFPLKASTIKNDPLVKISAILSHATLSLADKIVVYSNRIIIERELQKMSAKVIVAPRHFVDLNTFRVMKSFDKRDNVVGYFGSLDEIKGAHNFVKALKYLMETDPDFIKREGISFLMGGEGPLNTDISHTISSSFLGDRVQLLGWVPHDMLPQYLNKLKLLVIPSLTEGLPNILLEAIACGTPILATPVGSIPDVIEDGKSGFLMDNNTPECISANIKRALAHPQLEMISLSSKSKLHSEFTLEKAVDRYRTILESLND